MSNVCDVDHKEVVCALIWRLDCGQEQYLVAKREMHVNRELGGLYEFPRGKVSQSGQHYLPSSLAT
jgi:8-oxo-dGTP pyrophosphatase MutT (NUDIX family)